MKKVLFLSILFSFMTLAASAQVWIGGELYFKSNSASLGGLEVNSNKSLGILPEVGYQLNDKWAVALKAEYSHSNDGTVSLTDQTLTGNINKFSVIPFVRYTIYKTNNFSFLLDGGVGYSLLDISGYNNVNSFSVAVSPALAYDLNDHWGLTAHLGRVGYEHQWTEIRKEKLKNNDFSFDIFGGLTFGIHYKF